MGQISVVIQIFHGVIYGSAQDDYTFAPGDVKNCTFSGKGPDIAVGNEKKPSMRFILEFADGKKAQADIIFDKVDLFKASFGLWKKYRYTIQNPMKIKNSSDFFILI